MFTRSRSGRRAPPARLDVERLEDRFVPSGPPMGAGFAAPALVGAAVVGHRPDGPAPDHGGPHSDFSSGKHTGPAEDHGPATVLGRGHGAESDGPASPAPGESSSGHSSGAHATPSAEEESDGKSSASASGSHSGTVLGRNSAESTTARKGPETSDEDGSGSEASSSRHAASTERPSGTILDRGESSRETERAAPAGTTAPAAALAATSPPTTGDDGTDAGPTGASSASSGKAADGGLVGPQAPAAVPAVADSSAGTAARTAAPVASASGVPVPVLNRTAAAQGAGDDGAPEAAPAAFATGADEVLALLDSRSAGPAALHAQADLDEDFLAVPLTGDITLVRGGAQAEPADLGDAGAPAVAPAPYAGYAAAPAPAGGLLDRLALDTHALDAALQNFLHGLDRLGERLADPRTRLGVSAWLLSGAAALAAVELNRRRRAAAEAAADVPLTWPGPGGPAPEPAA
jgi:hypothetical protein